MNSDSLQPTAKWKARKAPDENLELFVSKFGNLLGKVLWSRGFNNPEAENLKSFLDPKLQEIKSPSLMKNMDESIERLCLAIQKNERVCIYSDYDMDGIAGLSLLYSFLKACNIGNVMHFQPHRFDDGYGVHPAALEKLAKEENVSLVITVDTGTTAVEAVERANELGLDVIITDHHAAKEILPATPWLINPNQPGDTSELGYLSGTGMAFYFCMALRQKLREQGHFKNFKEPDLRQWLDLFCLGTIGDVVDLRGDNRALIRAGLGYLINTSRPGLKVLIESCVSADQLSRLNARDLAFSVIPKLNAASRMGKAELSTELLLTPFRDRAEDLVEQILELNEIRSATQNEIMIEATAQAQEQSKSGAQVIVVCGEWHEGVLGIVAAKLVEEFSKPAIVLSKVSEEIEEELNEESTEQLRGSVSLRGSMRSPAPFHCLNLLAGAEQDLIQFGGHQAAAGMKLYETELDSLRASLNSTFERLYLGDNFDSSVEQSYDAELSINDDLKVNDVMSLASAEPFGAGNPEPTFLIRAFPGEHFSFLKDRHLKVKNIFGVPELIGFNHAKKFRELCEAGATAVDLLVVPELNVFRNQAKAQLRIQAIRSATPKL